MSDNRFTDHLGRPLVAVTGMGVITSLGQGLADNWSALTSGTSGIHKITRFPTFFRLCPRNDKGSAGAGWSFG